MSEIKQSLLIAVAGGGRTRISMAPAQSTTVDASMSWKMEHDKAWWASGVRINEFEVA